jgi:hypothetical protein
MLIPTAIGTAQSYNIDLLTKQPAVTLIRFEIISLIQSDQTLLSIICRLPLRRPA